MKKVKYLIAMILGVFSTFSFAQSVPTLTEGKDYTVSQVKDNIVSSNTKKPVLIEFFWYGCSHCFKMKPMAEALAHKYNNQIEFVRYPVGFPNWESGTRLFFALESLNLVEKFHDKVFNEVQVNRNNILDSTPARIEFFKKNSIDPKKIEDALTSFSVTTKFQRAKQITKSYGIESSPSYAVYANGYTYQVSPGMVNSYEKTIENLDKILASSLKNKK